MTRLWGGLDARREVSQLRPRCQCLPRYGSHLAKWQGQVDGWHAGLHLPLVAAASM